MKFTTLIRDKKRSAAAMTVRAQEVAANNPDQLRWEIFANREQADSMRVADQTDVDFRFVAERRPYNTAGLEMPEKFGALSQMLHLPIQAKKTIEEDEIEMLAGGTDDEKAQVEALGKTLPARVEGLSMADMRRVEMDFFQGWALGTILAKNFISKIIAIISFGFAAFRYQVAATAWNNGSVNAWQLFIAWYRAEKNRIGGAEGVLLSGKIMEAIREDAPQNQLTGLPLGDSDLASLVASQTGGGTFKFVVDDRVADVPTDNTNAPGYDETTGTAPGRYWPVGRCAIIPLGVKVGRVRFAPVRRASDLAGVEGAAKIQKDDVTIVYVTNNDDTELEIQAQLNAYPAYDERKIAVIDTGIQ